MNLYPALSLVHTEYGLPEQADYYVEACLSNTTSCTTEYHNVGMDLCSHEANDDDQPLLFVPDAQECGAAGTYHVSISFKIPGDDGDETASSWFSSWFTSQRALLRATLCADDFSTTICTITAAEASSNSYQMAMAAVGFFVVVTGGLACKNRKHRVSVDDVNPNEGYLKSSFERMEDSTVENGMISK